MTLHKVLHKFVIALKRAKLASCSQSTGENTKRHNDYTHFLHFREEVGGAKRQRTSCESLLEVCRIWWAKPQQEATRNIYLLYLVSQTTNEFCLATICTNNNQSCRRSLIASRLRSALRLCPEAVAKHPWDFRFSLLISFLPRCKRQKLYFIYLIWSHLFCFYFYVLFLLFVFKNFTSIVFFLTGDIKSVNKDCGKKG